MSNTSIVGLDGAILLGTNAGDATPAGNVTSVSLTRANDAQETTTFQDEGWKTYKGGLNSFSGNVEFNFDTTDNFDIWCTGDVQGYIAFNVDAEENPTQVFSGAGIFSNCTVTNKVGNVLTCTAQFNGTGALS